MFRSKSILFRISLITIAVLVTALVLVNIFVPIFLRNANVAEIENTLRAQAAQVNFAYVRYVYEDRDVTSFYNRLKDIAYRENCVIWVESYDATNVIGAEDMADYAEYENLMQKNKEELQESVTSGTDTWSKTSNEAREFYTPIVTVGSPLIVEGEQVGSVYLHIHSTSLTTTIRTLNSQSVNVFFGCAVLGLILSYVVSRWISRPLYDMNQAAKELARGDFSQRIPVRDDSELGQLARTFNMMVEELEKYEDTRESFVGNVSHELKSPLTAIQGFVQGMLDGTISPAERDKYLDVVLLETKRMNTLITDLLELVKIESGQFPIEKKVWNVNELIRRILINYISKIEDKHIELAVNIPEGPTDVLADQDRIAQVLTNLLDNAVKFTEESGTIKIWSYESDGKVLINIANSGKSIPEEDIRYIFDRFFKVDKSHNRKAPGTGIGLSIVKEIINRHGQKIWVNSRPEVGTVFTFTLALAPEKGQEKTQRANSINKTQLKKAPNKNQKRP